MPVERDQLLAEDMKRIRTVMPVTLLSWDHLTVCDRIGEMQSAQRRTHMAAQARRGTIKSWVLLELVQRGAIIKSGIRIAVCLLAVGCVKVKVQQMDQVVRPPRSPDAIAVLLFNDASGALERTALHQAAWRGLSICC